MSSFVLCDESDWEELYQPEYYKWFRIKDAEDLLGHPSIAVYVHEDWQGGYEDDRIEYLEQQIEILAKFGYIKLVYKWSDGREEPFKMDSPQVIQSPQMDMFESLETGAITSSKPFEATVTWDKGEEDCEGGSCKI